MSQTKGTFENLGDNYNFTPWNVEVYNNFDDENPPIKESPYFATKEECREWIIENNYQNKECLIWNLNNDW